MTDLNYAICFARIHPCQDSFDEVDRIAMELLMQGVIDTDTMRYACAISRQPGPE